MARDYEEYNDQEKKVDDELEVAIIDVLPTQPVRQVEQDGKTIKLLSTNEAVQILWNKIMLKNKK